jgi:hypothetical protein
MARNPRYLTRWQVVAVIALAVLILPMSAAFGWLEANRPRTALAVFIAGYACVVGLIGFLAWNACAMVARVVSASPRPGVAFARFPNQNTPARAVAAVLCVLAYDWHDRCDCAFGARDRAAGHITRRTSTRVGSSDLGGPPDQGRYCHLPASHPA